jgi:AcrR family transcriptional regulator
MDKKSTKRLSREDWVRGAIEALQERGIDGLKIVVLAERLGVTSGSFYWHFKNLRELHLGILEFWERELTDHVMVAARAFEGSPEERIFNLMLHVMLEDAAAPDHAILVWSRSDDIALEAFRRTLEKRFRFARWMFMQAGFSPRQAARRGRLMVAYLMGESSTNLKSRRNWRSILREQFEILISTGT